MRILVAYYSRQGRLRQSVADHLFSFRQYSGHECVYVNLGLPWTPAVVKRLDYDLVVLHTILLWERVDPPRLRAAMRRGDFIRGIDAPKIMLPQDEHLRSGMLEELALGYGVGHVFSCAGPDTWPSLYPRLVEAGVRLHTVLTGYLAGHTLERIERLSRGVSERTIDVGYRARLSPPSLGRHGRLKVEVGEVVGRAAREAGLRVDVSNRSEDTLLGDDWYRFLLRCKYTLGVEGGASVPDPEGKVMRCVLERLESSPDLEFEQLEEACFPGLDGTLDYFAVSPRHLEACATRTCQVLVEGGYSGVLRPGVHYIELNRDFSNLERVLAEVQEDSIRARIVESAYADVVASGRYTYRGFVEGILAAVWPDGVPAGDTRRSDRAGPTLVAAFDRATWPALSVAWWLRRVFERLLGRRRVSLAVTAVRRRFGE